MREYPKIETVWARDERTKRVVLGQCRWPEFGAVSRWWVTEKVDGTNIRIGFTESGDVMIGGRTDRAQLPSALLSYLLATFTPEKLRGVFDTTDFTLFGEGYGPKIQKGGGAYRADPSFRLFDVLVGHWWLEPENVAGVAQSLGVRIAPELGTISTPPTTAGELAAIVDRSIVAAEDGGSGCRAEGIVARSFPLMLTRRGDRVMWKLKYRDFE